MAHFCYEVKDPQGNRVIGRANGPSHMDVVRELSKVGYEVIRVWQKPPYLPGTRIWTYYRRASLSELSLLTRELAMFFASGIGLVRGLECCEEQGFSKHVSQAAADVAQGLHEGRSLSQAMAMRPDVFPPLYVKLVHAGEISGSLDQVLFRLSDYVEKELLLSRKVQSALAYPALIFAICLLLTGFLVYFLFPLFISFFNGLDIQLPAITQSLLAVTTFMRQPWVILLLLLSPVALSKVYDVLSRTDSAVNWFSNFLFDIPVYGQLKKAVVLSRFCSTLEILLNAGIPQFTALNVTAEAMDNMACTRSLKAIALRIRDEGDSLAEAVRRDPFYPQMLSSLIMVGEEVGNMPRVLNLAYKTYEMDVETTVGRMTVLLEPLILFVMGVVVGYVLLAVFLPIYSMLDGL